jgi:hypothetical protein
LDFAMAVLAIPRHPCFEALEAIRPIAKNYHGHSLKCLWGGYLNASGAVLYQLCVMRERT